MIVLIGGNGNKRVRTLRFTIRKKTILYLKLKQVQKQSKISLQGVEFIPLL